MVHNQFFVVPHELAGPLQSIRYSRPLLVYGEGRSYGDCCLNDGGVLLDASGLNRFIQFDADTGILRCEAGVTLQFVLDVVLPEKWFLQVTPDTQFVTRRGRNSESRAREEPSSSGISCMSCDLLRAASFRQRESIVFTRSK